MPILSWLIIWFSLHHLLLLWLIFMLPFPRMFSAASLIEALVVFFPFRWWVAGLLTAIRAGSVPGILDCGGEEEVCSSSFHPEHPLT
jgi:hypothetical protein